MAQQASGHRQLWQLRRQRREAVGGPRMRIAIRVTALVTLALGLAAWGWVQRTADDHGEVGTRSLHGRRMADYPSDAFTPQQRHKGAVLLHAVGVLYMFIGLAIGRFISPSCTLGHP